MIGWSIQASGVSAQSASIRGRVIDQDSRAGIAGALISVASAGRSITTSVNGEFEIGRLPAGRYRLTFAMLGYGDRIDSVTVRDQEEVSVIVSLSRSPIALEVIHVEARVGSRTAWLGSRGFFQRGEAGHARLHLTQEQLVHKTVRNVRDVLRLTPGVRVRRLVDGDGEVWLEPSPLPDGSPCRVGVYLNGSEVEFGKFIWRGARWNQTAIRPMRFDDLLQLEEVDAIELYGPEEMPVAAETCGALLLWSEKVRPAVDEPFAGIVRGKAISDETGQPIGGVRVILRPSGTTVETDSSGQFEIPDLVPGQYEMLAEISGAAPWRGTLQVRAYGIVTVELRMGSRDIQVSRPVVSHASR